MKIKNKLGNADTDRTKVYQIMLIRSAFDFLRVLKTTVNRQWLQKVSF